MNNEQKNIIIDYEYFSESDYFNGKFNYIHTYLHRNYKYRMHSHQFYEINIIASGSGQHFIKDTCLSATAGDIFVIPPGISHSYHSDDALDIYHILIKNDFLNRYAEELSEVEGFSILFDIEPLIRQASGRNINLNLGAPELQMFRGDLEHMMKIEESGRYVYLNALVLAFICRLCRRITDSVSKVTESDIVSVMNYIRNNLDKKLSIANLSAYAGMSSSTLNRHFRDMVGTSPMDYVLSCRVSRAKELLKEGNLSKTEIAGICGFYDIAHMNKYLG